MHGQTEDTVAAPWMLVALRRLGVREFEGANRTIATHEVAEMLRYVGVSSVTTAKGSPGTVGWVQTYEPAHVTHWCAAFANSCLSEAGYVGTKSAAAVKFLNWGDAISSPRQGAVAVLKRPGGHHVGFFVEALQNGKVLLIGGNQSDMVCYRPFTPSSVLGYRWPALSDRKDFRSALKA